MPNVTASLLPASIEAVSAVVASAATYSTLKQGQALRSELGDLQKSHGEAVGGLITRIAPQLVEGGIEVEKGFAYKDARKALVGKTDALAVVDEIEKANAAQITVIRTIEASEEDIDRMMENDLRGAMVDLLMELKILVVKAL